MSATVKREGLYLGCFKRDVQNRFGQVRIQRITLSPRSKGSRKKKSARFTADLKELPQAVKKIHDASFVPLFGDCHRTLLEIDVFPRDRLGSLRSTAAQTEKLDKVSCLISRVLEMGLIIPEKFQDFLNFLGLRDSDCFGLVLVGFDFFDRIIPSPSSILCNREESAQMSHVNLGGASRTFKLSFIQVFLDGLGPNLVDFNRSQRRFGHPIKMPLDAVVGHHAHFLCIRLPLCHFENLHNRSCHDRDLAGPRIDIGGPELDAENVQPGIGNRPDRCLETLCCTPPIFIYNGVIPTGFFTNEEIISNAPVFFHVPWNTLAFYRHSRKIGSTKVTFRGYTGKNRRSEFRRFSLVKCALSSAVERLLHTQEKSSFFQSIDLLAESRFLYFHRRPALSKSSSMKEKAFAETKHQLAALGFTWNHFEQVR